MMWLINLFRNRFRDPRDVEYEKLTRWADKEYRKEELEARKSAVRNQSVAIQREDGE